MELEFDAGEIWCVAVCRALRRGARQVPHRSPYCDRGDVFHTFAAAPPNAGDPYASLGAGVEDVARRWEYDVLTTDAAWLLDVAVHCGAPVVCQFTRDIGERHYFPMWAAMFVVEAQAQGLTQGAGWVRAALTQVFDTLTVAQADAARALYHLKDGWAVREYAGSLLGQ